MNERYLKLGCAALTVLTAMNFAACSAENGAMGPAGAEGVQGLPGAQGTPGASCSAMPIADGSGYTLTCGNKEIGDILSGKDGINGKNGANCSAAPNADTTGYIISCDGKDVGLIKNGVDGSDGDSGTSCSAEALADDSGFTLTCGEETIGTIMNGKAGQSCSGKSVVDEKTKLNGVEIVCGDEVVGTIWTGEKGETGTSCTMTENAQKTGYAVTCGDEMVGTILHGDAGESCSVSDTTDTENGKTGYKLTCGEEVKGVVWNGTDGTDGKDGENAKTVYTMAMMNVGGTLREYVASDDGSMTEGTVANGEKGIGDFVTWNGKKASETRDYQIKTGLDENGTSGWWYGYTDVNYSGTSTLVWPATIPANESKDAVIDACGGLCASVNIGEGSEYPFAGFGFTIVKGKTYSTSSEKGGNISNWKGLCVAYSAGGTSDLDLFIKVNNADEERLTDWNSYRFYLPVNNSGIVNIPWSAFKQLPGATKVPEGGFDQILEDAVSVNIEFQGDPGEAGYVNIQKVGMYGHCGDVVEAPNPYEGIPQYEFVAGTNIIKPFTASSADKSSDFNTWKGVDGQSNFPNGTGWMSFYTDRNSDDPETAAENRSDFVFPVEYQRSNDLIAEGHVKSCDGVCGTVQLKESVTGVTGNRYAGIIFDVKEDGDKGSDLSGIKGLCLTYTLKGNVDGVHLRLNPMDEKNTTGYNYHRKALPQAETPITLNIPWSEFKQERDENGDLTFGKEKSIDYVVKQAQDFQVFFGGSAGQSADFNIMQLGAYGNCQ